MAPNLEEKTSPPLQAPLLSLAFSPVCLLPANLEASLFLPSKQLPLAMPLGGPHIWSQPQTMDMHLCSLHPPGTIHPIHTRYHQGPRPPRTAR